jgi:hypothetical protein
LNPKYLANRQSEIVPIDEEGQANATSELTSRKPPDATRKHRAGIKSLPYVETPETPDV